MCGKMCYAVHVCGAPVQSAAVCPDGADETAETGRADVVKSVYFDRLFSGMEVLSEGTMDTVGLS